MRRAAEGLLTPPDFCLIDGLPVKGMPFPFQAIVKGDALSWSIGAASILAKEHRDALMRQLALRFPQYGFERHAGYGREPSLREPGGRAQPPNLFRCEPFFLADDFCDVHVEDSTST